MVDRSENKKTVRSSFIFISWKVARQPPWAWHTPGSTTQSLRESKLWCAEVYIHYEYEPECSFWTTRTYTWPWTLPCAKLGLMRVQESYIDTFTSQVAAPGLFEGFSFHSLKKLKVGGVDSWSTPQPRGKNTVKRNSKRESSRKSSKNRRLFPGANLFLRLASTKTQLTEKLSETSSVRWNLQVRICVQVIGDTSISEISESESGKRPALSRKRSVVLNIWQECQNLGHK